MTIKEINLVMAVGVVALVALISGSAHARQSSACAIEDVSEKDFVPMMIRRTLFLRRGSGYATDSNNVRVPTACVGVFTSDHRLVASATTDDEGRFQLPAIAPGEYRFIARAPGFCVAVFPLRIVAWPQGGLFRRRHMVLHMEPGALDVCSYGSYR